MDIRFFTYLLLILAIGTYFMPVDNVIKDDSSKDTPLVVFEKPLMHTINEQNVSRTVIASRVVRYKARDEMHDADILLRNSLDNTEYKEESLKAKVIIKIVDELNLRKDVIYKRDDFISLNTNELNYNLKTKLAQNNTAYTGNYYNNSIDGTNLYLDGINNYMKSNNVHFQIEVKNNK